jgi:hypothetical protein
VRYADDFVMGFQYGSDAIRLQEELEHRLSSFNLDLHKAKTRLIEFGRFAADNRAKRGKGKPETFDFLGFTHICSKRRSDGKFSIRRKTIPKRMRRKLKETRKILRSRFHWSIPELGNWLSSVVRGHFNYYGVPGNCEALNTFRSEVAKAWLKALRRRSQKGDSLTWSRFKHWIRKWFPRVSVVHPYPNKRLCV